MKACALIPAAGRGERFGRGTNKVFAEIGGKPVLAHTLSVFESCNAIGEIIVVTGKDDIEAVGKLVDRFAFKKVTHIVVGGEHRQDSVRQGLEKVTGEIVAIHDAARPMVTCDIIEQSIEEARRSGACVAAVPVVDTIKRGEPLPQLLPGTGRGVESDSCAKGDAASGSPSRFGRGLGGRLIVSGTVDRANLYSIQTPQTFKTDLIRKAYESAYSDGIYATDDAALVERMGEKVAIVEGSYDNIKITTPSDIELASMKLGALEQRTGIGFDVHALVEGRKLILGGVEIPFEKGLAGHSDADVLVHAIMDALLGAAALGDIGTHFPDSDPSYKGISSIRLLAHVGDLLTQNGWKIINLDAVVICERPKISGYVPVMIGNIAGCLGVDPGRISVKGTTTEGLGYTGRGEGIACQAVAAIGKP